MDELFSVRGLKVLVTGGSRGIGAMIAEGFLRHGARVWISARKAPEVMGTAERLSALGPCTGIVADLADPAGIEAIAAAIEAETDGLDVLVNNAGAVWAERFEAFTPDAWDKVMTVNLKSAFFLTQRLHPLLCRAAAGEGQRSARVINVGSIDGLHVPPLETYPYSASKAGMHHMTRTLAARLATDNIRVNCIAPGPFESRMMAATLATMGDAIRAANPLKRIGTPEDVAGTAIFLASRASDYITGAVIPVDGGTSTTL
jgi:NAD(P)-dependent dehydrogenase (short-subunit alcohol dehydrogenase family)